MNTKIQIGRVPGGGAPNVLELPYNTGQTFLRGAVLVSSGNKVSEAASPVPASQTNLIGIALQDAASNPGFNAANSPTVVTGQRTTVSVAKADNVTIFAALCYNSTTQVTSAATLAGLVANGTAYGLRKQAAGFWTVDTSLTGVNGYVNVVDYDPDTNIVLFKFVPATVQQ